MPQSIHRIHTRRPERRQASRQQGDRNDPESTEGDGRDALRLQVLDPFGGKARAPISVCLGRKWRFIENNGLKIEGRGILRKQFIIYWIGRGTSPLKAPNSPLARGVGDCLEVNPYVNLRAGRCV